MVTQETSRPQTLILILEKVGTLLVNLADQLTQDTPAPVVLSISATTSVETVSRALTRVKARGLITLTGLRWRSKQAAGHDVDKPLRIYTRLPHQRDRLAEAFDHCGDQEIAAEFHHVGPSRHVADDECPLAHCIEQWLATRDHLRIAASNDE